MRIAIIGTRGIPNNYGGFEQFAEFISTALVEKGFEVTVYNPHFHPYTGDEYKGVSIRRIYCPEDRLGSSAHFLYDYLSLKDAIRNGFDVIYAAGYGTLAPALLRFGKVKNLAVNMDGIEWKRSKWNAATKRIMRWCERITVKRAAHLISDNEGVKDYYLNDFGRDSAFIPYGADVVESFDPAAPSSYGLEPKQYYLCIGRLEPENNMEMAIDGYLSSGDRQRPFVVVGGYQSSYGQRLLEKYGNREAANVVFLGPIYDKNKLDSLRHYSKLYFHGHSVGGTNPSLLEAMAAGCPIAAHDNPFNRSVLNLNAFYFSNSLDVQRLLSEDVIDINEYSYIKENLQTLREKYTWGRIVEMYEIFFTFITRNSKPLQ